MTQDVRDLIADARGAMTERDDTGWFWVGRLADALEAATRVPVQGEPNDDREAAEAEATRRWGTFADNDTRQGAFERDSFIVGAEFVISRATVPDTATEELRAERDAAVAAIERVRAIHRSEPTNGYNGQVRYECFVCGITSPCPTIQALDGAPEPEWEWGYAGETLVGVHAAVSREAADEDVQNLRRYWKDERKFWVVQRTPASEWLPVEGEKP